MTDCFSIDPHHGAFVANVAVGVDLYLDPAVRKYPFGHDGDHINALDFLADDKGGRLIIGVGCARANGGHKIATALDNIAVPILRVIALIQKRDGIGPRLDHCQRIKAHQLARMIGIAVTGTGFAFGDKTHHRAGVAANFRRLSVAQIVRHVRPPVGQHAGAWGLRGRGSLLRPWRGRWR